MKYIGKVDEVGAQKKHIRIWDINYRNLLHWAIFIFMVHPQQPSVKSCERPFQTYIFDQITCKAFLFYFCRPVITLCVSQNPACCRQIRIRSITK